MILKINQESMLHQDLEINTEVEIIHQKKNRLLKQKTSLEKKRVIFQN